MNHATQETETETLLLINGAWVRGVKRQPILDKYRLTPCAQVHLASPEQVTQAIDALQAGFAQQTLTPYARGQILDAAVLRLQARQARLVALLQQEAGFTQSDAQGEFARCLDTFRLSAQEARSLVGAVIPIGGAPNQVGRVGMTVRVPLGVVCAITPFNAPLNTVAHKVAPAIAAGNVVLLKPSLHTPTLANEMAAALLEAGLPPDMIAVLHGDGEVVRWIAADQRVRFFAFTGSTEVGRIIQGYAGLRRTQMELGSLSFTYLADDANLDLALPKVLGAAYRKAGQVCTSIQILLVHEARYEEVLTRLTPMVQALRAGDPAAPETQVGPVISEAAAQRIHAWIAQAVATGARVLAGGQRHGAVVAPTLLTEIDDGMAVGCQEVFGPVMSVVPVVSLDAAIGRMNATPFGLAAGVFTNRLDEAFRATGRLQVGNVFINETSSARVDVMPYGGSKESGFGREGPHAAVREMTEERMVTWTV